MRMLLLLLKQLKNNKMKNFKLKILLFPTVFFTCMVSYAQSNIVQDTISGFYLTKSYEGYTGSNYESLVLEERPIIHISYIEKVDRGFDSNTRTVVILKLNKEGAQKLKTTTTNHIGEPMVLVFETKIITAPFISGTIDSGYLEISGDFSVQEATSIVNWIKKKTKAFKN